MNQSVGDAPGERLVRLEQETERLNSQLKRATRQISFLQLAFLFLAASLVGGGYYLITSGMLRIEGLSPSVAKVLETKEFGLYNRDGDRMVLGTMDKFGLPQFIFTNQQKQLRMRIKVFPEGDGTAGVALFDESGYRGVFRMDQDGAAVLNLLGTGQKGGITMAVAPDGTPSLKMTDKEGKVLWEAPPKSN